MHFEDQVAADITVRVEDEEYHAGATVDLDGDGIADTALVEYQDGSEQAVTDLDGDGVADRLARYDAQGAMVTQAWYDSATGQWVDSTGSTEAGRAVLEAGRLGVETPQGIRDLGPAESDTDGDGVPDTVVVSDPAGGSVLYTDVDGDGCADVATEISSDGRITVSEHLGDGAWTVVERGRLVPDGSYQRTGERADDALTGFAPPASASSGSQSSGSRSAGSG